ncbi:MAG: YceI family protein [Alphaproteobacteria bacterium]|nr:YceI family protein [Alphaproteobacteria bacterium]
MKKPLLATAAFLALAVPAYAASKPAPAPVSAATAPAAADYAREWQIDPLHSTLTFTGTQSGQSFSGGFQKFTAHVLLNPDHPETGKITVDVDPASAYAGSDDRDSMLPGKDWFDVAHFPQAQFVSTAIHQVGPGQYQADATLTIKGISRNVTLPFTLKKEGDHWRAQGHVVLSRDAFGIGLGMFANENYVKNAVDVAVDLSAKPAP